MIFDTDSFYYSKTFKNHKNPFFTFLQVSENHVYFFLKDILFSIKFSLFLDYDSKKLFFL